MQSGRGEAVVDDRGQQHLDDRRGRPAVGSGVEVGAFHVGERRRDDNAAPVVRLGVLPGQHRKIRQFGQRDIHPERARPAAIGIDAREKVARQMFRRDQLLEQELRIDVRDHPARANDLAVRELDARGLSRIDDHARDGRAGPQRDAARRALRRHRLRDRAHAAARMSPLASLAVHLAEDVMQQHVRRTGRIGARVIADDGVEAEGGLDRAGLEPPIEHLAGALREEVQYVALPREVERAEALGDLPRVEHRSDPARRRKAASRARARAARRRRDRASRNSPAASAHRAANAWRLPLASPRFRRRP